MRLRALAITVVLLALAFARPAAAQSESAAFRVVVHVSNPVRELDRKHCAELFLKKVTRWSGDRTVYPVDLKSSSPVRAAFSRAVLGRSVAAVKSYWQQLIFSGRGTPPPEMADDAAVIRYVIEHPGAVGYVSGGADVTGVKAVAVR